MKTFNGIASYSGAICCTVEAEDELEAETKIKKQLADLSNDDFLEQLEPQLVDIEFEDLG